MDVLRWLRDAGLVAEPSDIGTSRRGDAADAVVAVKAGDVAARFLVELKGRAPYPNEVPRLAGLAQRRGSDGSPLLVAPFVSEPVGRALTAVGWSWADAHGNFDLRAPGLVLRQRRVAVPPTPDRTTLPGGAGSRAVVRALISHRGADGLTGTALAARARVSQPRVSQVLGQLERLALVERSDGGGWRADREALLDRFLAEYAGPGGSELHFYSLDPPSEVAVAAARACTPGLPVLVSADVGPDLLAPWRRPTVVVLYVTAGTDPAWLGLVEASGRHDANVIIMAPQDESVFLSPELVADVRGTATRLADPAQMIWDLQDLGGADRHEAAGVMREWLLSPRCAGSSWRRPRSPTTWASWRSRTCPGCWEAVGKGRRATG